MISQLQLRSALGLVCLGLLLSLNTRFVSPLEQTRCIHVRVRVVFIVTDLRT